MYPARAISFSLPTSWLPMANSHDTHAAPAMPRCHIGTGRGSVSKVYKGSLISPYATSSRPNTRQRGYLPDLSSLPDIYLQPLTIHILSKHDNARSPQPCTGIITIVILSSAQGGTFSSTARAISVTEKMETIV